MEAHTLRVLEYDRIRAMLADRAASSLGRELASAIGPSDDLDWVEERQRETSEARDIIANISPVPLGGIHDIRPALDKAEREGVLQPEELLDIADTLAAGRKLRAFLVKLNVAYPRMAAIAGRIATFQPIEEEIAAAIGPSGEVLDSASEALARVRRELKRVHEHLMERLHSMIQSPHYRNVLQEPIVTIRGDRYCIPVKAEYRGHVPGIVHDASASGATLFIEPADVVEMGNDLKQLALKERDEIEKVLKTLTGLITRSAQEIRWTVETLAEIDFICARARLSIDQQGIQPMLNREGRLRLLGASHPLLKGEVVPIDVELGEKFNTLLITGPNTGGKTVTLKTIGLLTLMAQSGLHVPAEPGTEIAVFNQVFADIGDEQSIEQSLSTFSSHMGNIVRVLKHLESNALVLLDEIGAGTDPDEGAALAKAIIEFLLERNARTVATTHYGELKEFAYLKPGVENACVEFDPETLRPTFHVMVGIPGSSNAFAIASRLGMPPEVVARAKDFAAGRADSSEEMIRRIEETHRAAIEDRREAERVASDALGLRARYEQELGKLQSAREKLEERVRAEGRELIDRYSRKLEKALEELRSYRREGKRTQVLEQKIKKTIREFEEKMAPPEPIQEFEEEPVEGHVFRRGETVRVASLNQLGILLGDVSGDEAMVQIGSIRVAVPAKNLRPVKQKSDSGATPDSRSEAVGETGQAISLEKARKISPELKLIAQRAEQAVLNLDKYLDEALAAGLSQVRIIHGRGTGRLKKAVWEHLSTHQGVESYRLGDDKEGGSGATVVMLKK